MAKLTREKLEQYLWDIREEDDWRTEANREAEYYDGNQLSADVLQQMKQRGIPPLVRNLVGPTIDVVLGMEAKNKRDWKLVADEEAQVDTAEALTVELKKAERQSRADRACSDAYASQIKVGVGWVEVARSNQPFGSPYRVNGVHRNEISYDWRARQPDLSDARYLVRRRWLDKDIVKLWFPKHEKLIQNAMNEWADWDDPDIVTSDIELGREFEAFQRTSLDQHEWMDSQRGRICLYEVWYRVWERGLVMHLPNDVRLEYDADNERHQQLVAVGTARLKSAVFPRVRLSWWVGPHQLADIPSPYNHNMFPYVPFFGYTEDRTGAPYGLIRRMKSPQDEINGRLSKMMWLLSAKRVIADSDAVAMPWQRVAEEVARPDALIQLDPNRKNLNADAFRVEQDFQLSQQQFSILQDATGSIQDAAGVYQAMLGKEDNAESGVAINSLVEQGSTTLAEINDNYRYARQLVGEQLLSLIRDDLGKQEKQVTIKRQGKKQHVVLNQMKHDEDGTPYLSNSVSALKARIDLSEVPDTPSYRMQQFRDLVEFTKSLPPDVQPIVTDLVARATDLPDRHEIADRIAQRMGYMDPEDMTPEEREEAQAKAQEEQQQKELELRERMAKVELDMAKTRGEMANSQHTQVKTEQLGVETEGKSLENSLKLDEHQMELEDHELSVAERLSQPLDDSSEGDEKSPSKPAGGGDKPAKSKSRGPRDTGSKKR